MHKWPNLKTNKGLVWNMVCLAHETQEIPAIPKTGDMTSDTHFHRSPVTDWLKSQKAKCSNPHQDLDSIKIVLVVLCPILKIKKNVMLWTNLAAVVFPPHSSLSSVQSTDMLTRASGQDRHRVLAEVSGHAHGIVKAQKCWQAHLDGIGTVFWLK